MSYLVLARKYRPKNFSEMVGQEHVVQALSNALATQRLHHAYLFTGTRGVGKTTVSRILAKSLNCTGADGQGGITATPCGACQACTEIDAGRFIDYTELDAASNRGVDEVQSLLEQAVYKPVQGRFKVFMIDEVHMLTNTAFNAMLKTLEEPPEYLKFVLATTDPQKVPVTVLSRCLQFNLRPIVPETIFAHLQHVLQAEGITAEPAALHLLARAARGSMRDALSLADQSIAYSASLGGQNTSIGEAAIRGMLGSVGSSHVFQLIEALANNDPATLLGVVQALQTHGLSATHTLEEMARILHRMAVWQCLPAASRPTHTAADDPDEAEITRLAAFMPADETQLLYSICLHGRNELGLAPDEYAGLSMVLLRLLAFKPAAEKKTLKTSNPSPETAARTTPATEASQPLTAPQPTRAIQQTAPAATTTAPAAEPRPAAQTAAPQTEQAPAATVPPATPAASQPATAASATPVNQAPTSPEPTSTASDLPPWENAPWEDAPAQAAAPAKPALATNNISGNTPATTHAVTHATTPATAQAVTRTPPQTSASAHSTPPSAHPAATTEAGAPPAAPASPELVLPVRPQPEPGQAFKPQAAAVPTSTQRLVPTELGEYWHDLAQQLCATTGLAGMPRELLLQSQLMQPPPEAQIEPAEPAAQAAIWHIRVETETINHEPSRHKLEQALSAHLGHPMRLQVEYGRVVDSPAMRQNAARLAARQQAEAALHQHPFVQSMMREFGAKILPSSISLTSSTNPQPNAKTTSPKP